MCSRKQSKNFKLNCFIFTGIVIGFLMGNAIVFIPCATSLALQLQQLFTKIVALERSQNFPQVRQTQTRFCTDDNLVFIGVLTAKEFLTSRVVASNNTWAKDFPGKVVYFAGENAGDESLPGIDLVALKGVNDIYPPQKKSFLMLKYMHDHYLDKYRFFMRADDDLYIKRDELLKFLHSVRSHGTPVIGSAGTGSSSMVRLLFKNQQRNYCMGGPGIIMSREILRKTGPNIKHCLKNLYVQHEDTEIGLCISESTNVSCIWNAQKVFYQNYKDVTGHFNHSLDSKDIRNAVTLHPIKNPAFTFRLHQHLLTLKANRLLNRLQKLARDVDETTALLITPTSTNRQYRNVFATYHKRARNGEEFRSWDFTRGFWHSQSNFSPKLGIPRHAKDAINTTAEQICEKIRSQGKKLQPEDISFIYSRTIQPHGHDYIVTLSKWHKNHKKITDSRYFYVHRPFLLVELTEANEIPGARLSDVDRSMENKPVKVPQLCVNVVVPLIAKYSLFINFIKHFEKSCLNSGQNVSLSLILFRNNSNDSSEDISSYINRLQSLHGDTPLRVTYIDGHFSSARAFQFAIEQFRDDDLLFFVNAHTILQPATLQRVRLNTINGGNVYSAVVFRPFHPFSNTFRDISTLEHGTASSVGHNNDYNCSEYSILAAIASYREDLVRITGFKETPYSGLRDADLINKFISHEITIFRSLDAGILHRFHPDICQSRTINLNGTHLDVKVTNSSSSVPIEILSDFIYRTPDIFNRSKIN